jgi:hypothetical protein
MDPISFNHLERDILHPARRVMSGVSGGGQYMEWLTARCWAVGGRTLPLVATHNDLTMWNVVREKRGPLGVVDWETARESSYPFTDFTYAVTDAVFAAEGFADRSAAVASCFARIGRYRGLVLQLEQHLRQAVPAPDEWVELCFHACWLQHAANESANARATEPRVFAAIARLLVNRSIGPVSTEGN